MTQARWILATLASHWRRHPLNFATLFAGLAIATALWSGVQALNAQARQSYDRAAALLDEAGAARIVGAKGTTVDQQLYVALRRAGWKVSPVIEGTVRIAGSSYRLIGIEPLTAPRRSAFASLEANDDLTDFVRAPGRTLVASETARDLGAADGAELVTDRGGRLPPLRIARDMTPGLLVVDIGFAQSLLGRPGQVSRLVGEDGAEFDAVALERVVGDELRIEALEDENDLSRLTASFHLNLTAFGLLAFVVGLFIVHASVGLAFEQRLGTVRTMRAVGVPLRLLAAVLVGELVLIALVAGAVGMALGYLMAAALLPDVAATLDGLYGAHIGSRLALDASWWVAGMSMAVLGALAASAAALAKVIRLPVLAVAQPLAWREAQQVQLLRQGAAGVLALVVAGVALLGGRGLVAGFIVIGGVLLAAALFVPLILSGLLRLGEMRARAPLSQWFWADTRQQISGLTAALMALLLALAANVGVGTMVEGFRKTFTGWLDARLNAEIYFDAATAADGEQIARWLAAQPGVSAVLPVARGETRIQGWPVDVQGMADHATYRDHFPLLAALPDAWDRLRDGTGVFASEQLARRLGVGVGDTLSAPSADGAWKVPIAAIFADYGNPKGQVRVGVDPMAAKWPDARRTSYVVRARSDEAGALIAAMQERFGSGLARAVDQATIKALSVGIFERTFAVTAALNTLTLAVSGIALFASLLTLSDARLVQLAPVWALGVSRRRLTDLEIGKILTLAALTAVIAVPLGLVLAWCLVAIVNVEAFGWRLPFHVFPSQWITVLALALVTALLAVALPAFRLARRSPADLVKVFANER